MSDIDENEKDLLAAFDKQTQDIELKEYTDSLKKDYIAHAGKDLEKGNKICSVGDIISALKTVEDPEISINIYDLGLVYDIRQKENGDIEVDMTVTTPMCPVAGILPQQAADAIASLDGAGKVEVKIVWEPAWTPDRMSDDAKMMFEIF